MAVMIFNKVGQEIWRHLNHRPGVQSVEVQAAIRPVSGTEPFGVEHLLQRPDTPAARNQNGLRNLHRL
jgi:hypothetical protein